MVKNVSNRYRIPFDRDGNQLHYADPWSDGVEWKDNHQFDDTLKMDGMQRGHSAAYFHVVSVTTGKRYTLFMRYVIDIMVNTVIDHGVMHGTWTFTKRGENYGIAIMVP